MGIWTMQIKSEGEHYECVEKRKAVDTVIVGDVGNGFRAYFEKVS